MKRPFLSRQIVNPLQKPWSFASSYPAKEQIDIEELWQLDEKRNFANRIERTKGSIVLGDDILAIEFFE